MKLHFSLLLLAATALTAPAAAQSHPAHSQEPTLKILNGPHSDDSVHSASIHRIFVENAPKAFHVPGAPRFAVEGMNGKFYLGFGGTVKATTSFDWGSPIDNAFNFTTSAIPMSVRKGDGGKVQFSAATSSFFFNFVAMPGDKNQLGAYINVNFTGNNYTPSLYFAYIKFRGITAGYNFSLFSDMAAIPPSIDNEGPNALTAIPNGVVDYTHTFNKHWSAGTGIEMPIASATDGAHCYLVSQRVPDVPAYVQYSWGGGSNWLRASAIVRNILYRDQVADKNRDQVGWGIKMSGSAALSPWVRAYWQGAYGHGITSYFQDLYEGGLDLVPSAADPGRMKAVKAWGAYAGLQYTLSRTLMATTTYSHLRNYAPDYAGGATPWPQQYSYAQYALANLLWQVTPVVQTGIEYIYGRRVDMSGHSRHDNRIQAMLQVSF